MKKQISVVLTTYNRKYEVRRALESVYSQTVKPYEIILIDDVSTDGTQEYINSSGFENLKYIKLTEKSGCGAARNCGIRLAEGDYIAFLDSDNEWYGNKLEKFTKSLEESDVKWDILCSQYKKHMEFGIRVLPEKYADETWDANGEILVHNPADASAAVYRKDFLLEAGLFSEDMSTNLDWELLLRAAVKRKILMKKVDGVLTENWTMFDGLEENREIRMKEYLKLLRTFEKDILSSGYSEAYFHEYLKYMSEVMPEADAVSLLLEESNFPAEWGGVIFSYHKRTAWRYESELIRKSGFYMLLSNWLQIKLNGDSVSDRLLKNHYETVAIYGAGKHGKMLYQDLRGSGVCVRYFIDRNKEALEGEDVPVYSTDDELPPVDAVIISPYLESREIAEKMKNCMFPLITLDRLMQREDRLTDGENI